jgi:hypothetical protein
MFRGWTFCDFPRRYPHDMDCIADHVGGALFAFSASASIAPLKFDIDEPGIRVFLAEG